MSGAKPWRTRGWRLKGHARTAAGAAGRESAAGAGQGLTFEESRPYQPGDDPRRIDWRATARLHLPYVKRFTPELARTTILMLDGGPSLRWGVPTADGALRSLADVAADAVAAVAAWRSDEEDALALIPSDDGRHGVPPGRGRRHDRRMADSVARQLTSGPDRVPWSARMADWFSRRRPTGPRPISPSWLEAVRRARGGSLVVAVTADLNAARLAPFVARAARRHDVLLVTPVHPWAEELPRVGLARLRDLADGTERVVDTDDGETRRTFEDAARRRRAAWRRLARHPRVTFAPVPLDRPVAESLGRALGAVRHGPTPVRGDFEEGTVSV